MCNYDVLQVGLDPYIRLEWSGLINYVREEKLFKTVSGQSRGDM